MAAWPLSRVVCWMLLGEPAEGTSPWNCSSCLARAEECSLGAPGWEDVLSFLSCSWTDLGRKSAKNRGCRAADNTKQLIESDAFCKDVIAE